MQQKGSMDHSVCQASAKSIGTHADGIRGDRVLTGVLSVYLQKKINTTRITKTDIKMLYHES